MIWKAITEKLRAVGARLAPTRFGYSIEYHSDQYPNIGRLIMGGDNYRIDDPLVQTYFEQTLPKVEIRDRHIVDMITISGGGITMGAECQANIRIYFRTAEDAVTFKLRFL